MARPSRRSIPPPEPDDLNDPAWHADPFQRHHRRWWDGERWSSRVRDGDRIGIDPPVIDPKPEAQVAAAAAEPIVDALQPLPDRNWGTIVGLMFGLLLIAALVILAILTL